MTDEELTALSAQIGERLLAQRASLTTAESCTGGWIAKVLTDVPGSSGWFGRGFVTYSNQAKQDMVNVSTASLEHYGAESEQVVREMAEGARLNAHAHYAVSVSGIAGPGGGSDEKPVGTVWFGFADASSTHAECKVFSGDRLAVRRQATAWALLALRDRVLQK